MMGRKGSPLSSSVNEKIWVLGAANSYLATMEKLAQLKNHYKKEGTTKGITKKWEATALVILQTFGSTDPKVCLLSSYVSQ